MPDQVNANYPERAAVLAKIEDLMIHHGPDGHIDGADEITDYVMELLAADPQFEQHACCPFLDAECMKAGNCLVVR